MDVKLTVQNKKKRQTRARIRLNYIPVSLCSGCETKLNYSNKRNLHAKVPVQRQPNDVLKCTFLHELMLFQSRQNIDQFLRMRSDEKFEGKKKR